jgi:MerC mercury resistance protein
MPRLQEWTPRQKLPKVQRMADLFAVSSSGLCMIHCLLTPVLLIFLPVLGASVLSGESFHAAILWFILPTSLLALTLGCWRHKERYVAVFCTAGLAVILIAARYGDALFGELGERILTSAGGLILIAGHFRNFSLCRGAACEE